MRPKVAKRKVFFSLPGLQCPLMQWGLNVPVAGIGPLYIETLIFSSKKSVIELVYDDDS